MQAEPIAVLWDFDGTMVDTEPLWASTEQEMLAEYGVHWGDEEMLACHGQSATVTCQWMAEAAGEPDEGEKWYWALHERIVSHLRRHGLPWLPGARELMAEMEAAGVRCAVVTASNSFIMAAAKEQLPAAVEFIVTADDVAETKPNPEAYQQAMQRLGVAPDDVLILEDSAPGTAAALASGAFVYAVPSIANLDDHPRLHRADEGLDRISWPELVGLWRANKGNQ